MCCYAFPIHLYNGNALTCWYCLVVLLQLVPHYLSLLWQAFMTFSVTKAMPIQFIDGKCHIKKQKSHKTPLFSYYAYLSFDLSLKPSGADTHTLTYTNVCKQNDFKKPGACAGLSPTCACGPHMPGLKSHCNGVWFVIS